VQVAFTEQPPLLVKQVLMAMQIKPSPEYPVLQVQVRVPGPVLVHVAYGEQPPLFVKQALMAVQVKPSPW
jgi:hypothetical protein